MDQDNFFTDCDPLGECRWREVGRLTGGAAEAVWAYGGPRARLTAQILSPHWKVCLAVRRQWDTDRGELANCRLMLLGPVATARINADPAGSEIVAIRLHPEYVASLLGVTPAELAGLDVEQPLLPALDPVRRLSESGASQSALGGALLNWAQRGLTDTRSATPRRAAELIRASGGTMPVRLLAKRLETSERTLRRHFLDEVGIGPKHYARSVRLQHLLLDADRHATPRWAELALDHGYADQSHMCNEMRSLTGIAVAQIHAMRRGPLAAAALSPGAGAAR